MRTDDRTETRGRKQTVDKEQVFDILSDKQWHTCGEMASELEASNPTVGKRVRDLVGDGWSILAGHSGYRLLEKEDITDEEAALAVESMLQRMTAIVLRQALVAKPIKKLAMAARKLLPKTPEERQIVRKYLVQLTHLIDFQELDEEEYLGKKHQD